MPDQEFGSDGQLHDVEKHAGIEADTPSSYVTADPPESVDPFAASEPAAASQRLREFEDKHLGADTPRHQGLVERGSGAPLRNLHADLQREHAELERAVRSESEQGGA